MRDSFAGLREVATLVATNKTVVTGDPSEQSTKNRSEDSNAKHSHPDKGPESLPYLSFQPHFEVPKNNDVFEFLNVIDQELSSQTRIHDWDKKFTANPVKALIAHARDSFSAHHLNSGTYINNYSSVDRVCSINGVTHRRYFATEYQNIANLLLPVDASTMKSSHNPLLNDL